MIKRTVLSSAIRESFEPSSIRYLLEAKSTLTMIQLVSNARDVSLTTFDRGQPGDFQYYDTKENEYRGTKSVLYTGTIKWNDSNTAHKVAIAFYDVDENNPASLSKSPCRVRCDCTWFYHCFSYYNWQDDALYGSKPRPYHRVVPDSGRPPLNPQELPGACKHIIAFARTLAGSGQISS